MTAQALERFLARLYTDDALRTAFLQQPERVALEAGLDDATRQCLADIDRDGLALAAHSFAGKRAAHARKRSRPGPIARLKAWLQA